MDCLTPIRKNNLTALARLAVLGALSQASALLSYFFEWVSHPKPNRPSEKSFRRPFNQNHQPAKRVRAHGTHPTRESKPAARRSVQLNHPHLAGLTIKEKCKQTARKPNKGRLKKVSYQFEKIIYKRAACRSDSRIRHLFAEQGTHIALAVGQSSDSRIRPTRMMLPNCFYFVRFFFSIGITSLSRLAVLSVLSAARRLVSLLF